MLGSALLLLILLELGGEYEVILQGVAAESCSRLRWLIEDLRLVDFSLSEVSAHDRSRFPPVVLRFDLGLVWDDIDEAV